MKLNVQSGANKQYSIKRKRSFTDIVLDEHDLAVPIDYREQAESMSNKEIKAIKRVTDGILLRYGQYVVAELGAIDFGLCQQYKEALTEDTA